MLKNIVSNDGSFFMKMNKPIELDIAICSQCRAFFLPTAGDLDPLQQLLSAVTAPYDERPGLERYAAPAPEDFGDYRTFCGT